MPVAASLSTGGIIFMSFMRFIFRDDDMMIGDFFAEVPPGIFITTAGQMTIFSPLYEHTYH